MKIKTKLLWISLGLSIVPALIVSILVGVSAYRTSHDAIELQINDRLMSLTRVKKSEVENYFKTIEDQVVNLANSTMTVSAVQAFDKAFGEFKPFTQQKLAAANTAVSGFYEKEFKPKFSARNAKTNLDTRTLMQGLSDAAISLQQVYVVNKEQPLSRLGDAEKEFKANDYHLVHERYHSIYKKYLETFDYYDIFLIDDESGNIVYSVFKEIDYATSLRNGPYAQTGIGEVFQRSLSLKKPGEVAIVDFSEYLPSYSYPASFIASPIFDGNRRVGTLIFQMPVEKINSLVNFDRNWENIGLEKTGAVYLVAKDGTMRNDYRHFLQSPDDFLEDMAKQKVNPALIEEIRTQETTIGLLTAPTNSAEKALSGEAGVHHTTETHGKAVISAFAPLKMNGLSWAVVSEIEQDEGLAPIYEMKQIIIIEIVVVTLLCASIAGGIGVFVAHQFVTPIRSLASTISQVETQGDFSLRMPHFGKDEIGLAGEAINRLLADVQSALGQVDEVVKGMAEGDFSHRIDRQLNGDLGRLKDAVNGSVELAESSMQSIDELMTNLSRGSFDTGEHPPLKGSYQRIVDNAYSAMEAVGGAITEILTVMKALSVGDFDQRVHRDLPGELNELKQRLNTSLDTLASATAEVEQASQAQSQGDLTVRVTSDYHGTLARLKENSNSVSERLIEVIDRVQQGANTVNVAAEEISQGNLHLSQRTEVQASDLEKTASSMSDITAVVARNAEQAQAASALSQEAKEAAEKGGEVASSATEAMAEINESSRLMSDIIGAINEIAFQTNLLALNASVEAARAGEQGRGFSVVASEVRALASRSAEAANQIKGLIESNIAKIQHGSKLVDDSGKKLTEIVESVQKVSVLVADISAASNEQSESIDSINRSIRDMDDNTQQNAALVQQVAAASESLSQQSQELQSELQYFTLNK